MPWAPRCFVALSMTKPCLSLTYIQPSNVIQPSNCHPERSEGSHALSTEMLRYPQHDRTVPYLHVHPTLALSSLPPIVMLSEAKHLTCWVPTCFVALNMTKPRLTIHHAASFQLSSLPPIVMLSEAKHLVLCGYSRPSCCNPSHCHPGATVSS